jgi:ABC-type nitrate/sulfonate/bicarbonate transport system substrate-binding protein
MAGKMLSSIIVDRRSFLRRVSLAGAGLAVGGPSPLLRSDPSPPSLGKIGYQLSWIKNFQFGGEYIADHKGYYRRFGLDVDLVAGGPNAIVEAMIASGRVLVGQTHPETVANAVNKGAALKCIGANYQKNVNCIMSLAKTPLATPRDLIGKRIGLQTGNLVVWQVFLKINQLDPASIHIVPVQFDFTPLVTGEVDGFFGYANDDAVQLRAKGIDIHCLLFADYGYKMFTATYAVTAAALTDKVRRAQLVAFMKGEILGWQDAIRDPDLAARLTVDVYGAGNGLDFNSQKMSCVATNDYIVNADTKKYGLFWMTPESVQETIAAIAASGMTAAPDIFTNEILAEAYGGKTVL